MAEPIPEDLIEQIKQRYPHANIAAASSAESLNLDPSDIEWAAQQTQRPLSPIDAELLSLIRSLYKEYPFEDRDGFKALFTSVVRREQDRTLIWRGHPFEIFAHLLYFRVRELQMDWRYIFQMMDDYLS